MRCISTRGISSVGVADLSCDKATKSNHKEVIDMKKFVSLFLVVVLCLLTVPMQAFALESDLHAEEHTQAEQTRGCSHPEIIVYETNPDGYVSVGSNGHKMQYKHSGICTSCNQTASMYTYGALEAHATPSIYAAECNGTWQPHHYYCRPCGGNETIRQIRCPAGPHTGGCTVLPV